MNPADIKPDRDYTVRRKMGDGEITRRARVLAVNDEAPPDFPGHVVRVMWFHEHRLTGGESLIHHDDVLEEWTHGN